MLSKIEQYELMLMPLVMILACVMVGIVGWIIIGDQSIPIITLPLLIGVTAGIIGTVSIHTYIYPITTMDRFTFLTRVTVIIILFPALTMLFLININYVLVLVCSNFIFGVAISILGLGSFITYQAEIKSS